MTEENVTPYSSEKKRPNNSLRQRSAARMAAVQCLYTIAMSGEELSPAQQVILLKKQLGKNSKEQKLRVADNVEPNYKLVESILDGIEQRGIEINTRLNTTLNEDWKRERMSPILLAILQCGIFEMFFDKEINSKIVVDEYTRLTRYFFADAEVDFVHAALSKLARQYK